MRKKDFRSSCLGVRSSPSPHHSNDKQQESNDFRPSRNSCNWCVAQDLAENSPSLQKSRSELVVPSRIRLATLRLSSRLSSRAWLSSVFAICSGNSKARRSTSVYTRIGWVLFVIWQFVPASMWTRTAAPAQARATKVAEFSDVAQKAGLTTANVFGGKNTSTYILESTGTGVAIFDYDNDGWPDIFFVNGTTLTGFVGESAPTNHLYHNNHDGSFTDVTASAGLSATGWGQGVCVGDYDNDGWEDLYVTYYGKNRLYHNVEGKFEEVGENAGVAGNGKTWGSGCAFVDYDLDGYLDLMVANYADFDLLHPAAPGKYPTCLWKGIAVFCGPRGLRESKNIL